MNESWILNARPVDAHKGDFGRVLILAGSEGMAGAAILTSTASLVSGAGLVSVGTPQRCLPTIAAANPSVMTRPLPETGSGRLALDALPLIQRWTESCDVLAAGPGWGRSVALDRIAGWLFSEAPCPVVLDADGLNALCHSLPWAVQRRSDPSTTRILTPHPGEFQRLWSAARQAGLVDEIVSRSDPVTRADMEKQANELARVLSCIILLKGPGTLITDGHRQHHNATGNPGMATAGSGDCLTGTIAAALSQPTLFLKDPFLKDPFLKDPFLKDPFSKDPSSTRSRPASAWDAVCLAAHVHGRAGDLAAQQVGEIGMTSLDLLHWLPRAWQEIKQQNTR